MKFLLAVKLFQKKGSLLSKFRKVLTPLCRSLNAYCGTAGSCGPLRLARLFFLPTDPHYPPTFSHLPRISTATFNRRPLIPNSPMAECRASGFYKIRENENSIAREIPLRGSPRMGHRVRGTYLIESAARVPDPLDPEIRPSIASHPSSGVGTEIVNKSTYPIESAARVLDPLDPEIRPTIASHPYSGPRSSTRADSDDERKYRLVINKQLAIAEGSCVS